MVGRSSRYTSEDVAILPCEAGPTPRFFFPIEFDITGGRRFPEDQFHALEQAISDKRRPISHVYIFVHGWNKTPYIAEREYQDFICRLHARIQPRDPSATSLPPANIIMIGVFWRSTLMPNLRDPLLLKWLTYFMIRKRADLVAMEGFQQLMRNVSGQVCDRGGIRQLNLIGHSFGGRMIVLGLQRFIQSKHRDRNDGLFEDFIQLSIAQTNIITLNAAIAPREVLRPVAPGEPTLMQIVKNKWRGHFFNVFSRHDRATGTLFPLASYFTADDAVRAIGAAPFGDYEVLTVSESGHVKTPEPLRKAKESVSNLDATNIVFDHSDIYKGRVATMLHELMTAVDPDHATPQSSS